MANRTPDLRERLAQARLYVISSDDRPERQAQVLCRAIDGGADVVQLRAKESNQWSAGKAALLRAALEVSAYARQCERLFIVNDHLDLAMAASADGVHLGQDDLPVVAARRVWGPGHLVGRSTHSLEQALAAVAEGADYLGVGPVFATPTKPGRPATGVELVAAVAGRVEVPWFAIGGIDPGNLEAVMAAGAERVAVVRAVSAASDPAYAAATLRARVAGSPVGGGIGGGVA